MSSHITMRKSNIVSRRATEKYCGSITFVGAFSAEPGHTQ